MLNFDRSEHIVNENIGAVRVQVELTNAVDEELVNRGLLNPSLLRVCKLQALVDTGLTRVLPSSIVQQLGLRIRGQEIAQYADGRQEVIGITRLIIIEILARQTLESAMVTGDEVLISQTVLETLDLLVDCKNQRLIPNPDHPSQPVLRI